MTASLSAKAPPSFLTLPTDIHTLIASHLDKTSVIELSRVARSLQHLATTDRLWRRLDLYLPYDYGEQPLVQPYERDMDGYLSWARAEAGAAEERHQDGLRTKLRTILKRGGEREWRAVRKMVICPSAASGLSMVQALDLASPNLQSLVLVAARFNTYQSDWNPSIHQTLDFRLLAANIALPSLTYLSIGPLTIFSPEVIWHLVQMSPSLRFLDVEYAPTTLNNAEDPVPLPLSPQLTETKLQTIQFLFDYFFEENEETCGAAMVSEIARCNPELRRVEIYRTPMLNENLWMDPAAAATIAASLVHSPELRDLRWPASGNAFETCIRSLQSGLVSVRRLILNAHSWVDSTTNMPSMPELEEIYFDASMLEAMPETMSIPVDGSQTVQIIAPDLARQLRINRCLHIIHTLTSDAHHHSADCFKELDAIKERGECSGLVHSLRCGDAELLHLRLFRPIIEIADLPSPVTDAVFPSALSTQVAYHAEDGSYRVKVFISQAAPSWQEFTEYEGLVVPLSILEDMRKVAGVDKASWNKRGVEVGEEVWKVLTDWHAGVLAA